MFPIHYLLLNNVSPFDDYDSSRLKGFPVGASGKEPPANAGDMRDAGSIPGLGRSPGGGNGNPLQYSSLQNPMDGGAWWATVHGVTRVDTA